jgi:hypothetical protein
VDEPIGAEQTMMQTLADMSEYTTERVVQGVGAHWEAPEAGDWLQLILRPSFDPEIVITAHRTAQGTEAVAHTAQCSLWEIHLHAVGTLLDKPLPPSRTSTRLAINEADAERLWAQAANVPESRGQRQTAGLDGMPLTIRIRLGAVSWDLESWSPVPDDPARPLIDNLLNRTMNSKNLAVATIAGQALRYLDDDA